MGVYDKPWDLTPQQADAVFKVESTHHFHGTKCLCGFDSHGRARSATEHITDATLTALGIPTRMEESPRPSPHPVADRVIRPGKALGFARWLAEHDREVAARTLRDAARSDEHRGQRVLGPAGRAALRARADRIAAVSAYCDRSSCWLPHGHDGPCKPSGKPRP